MTQLELYEMSGVSPWKLRQMELDHDCRIDDLLSVVGVLGVELGTVVRHPRRPLPWVVR